jgi:hypothetical protein
MNLRPLIAIAAVAFAGTSFAQTGVFGQEAGTPDAFTSAKSREQVQAELVQYKKENPISVYSQRYNPLTTFKSTLSRDEVRAAYIADRDEVAARTSEDSGAAFYAHSAPRGTVTVSPTLASAGAAQLR